MLVRITQRFRWSPTGNDLQVLEVGDLVNGRAAELAMAAGIAEVVTKEVEEQEGAVHHEKAVEVAPDNRAVTRAPKNRGRR